MAENKEGANEKKMRWNMKTLHFLVCIISILTLRPTLVQTAEKRENYFSDEVKTPHIAWCKPYAKGKIKVVVLAPAVSVRRIMEINQRIDLDIMGTTNYDRPEATALVKSDWDVCLLSDVNPDGLLPETRYYILKRAMEGRGLVVINPGFRPRSDIFSTKKLQERGHNISALEFPPEGLPPFLEGKEFILKNFPYTGLKVILDYAEEVKKLKPVYYINSWMDSWKRLPEYSDSCAFAETSISAYQVGAGRGVNISKVINLAEEVEFDFGRTITNYDYALALVAKAILWAAPEEKRADIVIEEISGGLSFKVEEVVGKEFKVILLNYSKEARQVKAHGVIRREDGITTDLNAVDCRLLPGKLQEVSFILPALRAGTYCLDIFVESKRGCEIFGSRGFNITSSKGIHSIELENDYVERGEKLKGEIILRQAMEGDLVRIEFVDNYGRVIGRREIKVTNSANPIPFTFHAGPDTTQLVRVRAALIEGKQELEQKEKRFSVPRRGRGKFNFMVWNIRRGILGYYAGQQMKSVGVTAILDNFHDGYNLSECAANDLMCVPYVTHLSSWLPRPKGKTLETYDGYGESVSWNKDWARDLEIKWRVDSYMATRKHGVFFYSLGDEINTKYVDASSECQEEYRKYLKKVYGTIETLNNEWDEKFKTFDEISLLKPGDIWEKEAYKQKRYPRWCDRQLFASENMMMVARQFREAFRERLNDPEALSGFEGLGLLDHDYLDFDQIMASVDWWMPYFDGAGINPNVIRSLQPRGFFSGSWDGLNVGLAPKHWKIIMSGMNTFAYWMWNHQRPLEPHIGFLAPAYNFHPEIQKVVEDLEVINKGLGDLFVNSIQESEPIALYYSIESALVSSFEENTSFNTVQSANKEFINIIHDLGFEFKYVTGNQVANGTLNKDKYKLLVLPCVQAIGPEQAAAIRKFVENGGLLVADMRPGIYDAHGKSISLGALDEVFGVRHRIEKSKAKSVLVQFIATIGSQKIRVNLGRAIVDTGYEPVKAKPLGHAGGVPVFFVNRLGKGQAILLNFNLAAQASPYAQHRLLQDLITLAGVKSELSITDAHSQPLLASRTVRWRTGEGKVIGIKLYPIARKLGNGTVGVKVTLPTPAHIYDIRQGGKYLGYISEVPLKMKPLQPEFLAVLPYRVNGLRIEPALPQIEQGKELTMHIFLEGVPSKGEVLHPLHIEAIAPEGTPAAYFKRNVLVKGRKGEITFLIAFNENPGNWKLRVKDVLTGKIGEMPFKVVGEAAD